MRNLCTMIIAATWLIAVGCKPSKQVEERIEEGIPSTADSVNQGQVAAPSDEPEEILEARAQVAALRAALEAAERDLDVLLKELSEATERIPATAWTGGPLFRLNNVEAGEYSVIGDVVTYSEDADVRLEGMLLSARSGEMRSDALQTRFWGDLEVEEEFGVGNYGQISIRREGNAVTIQKRLLREESK